MIASNSNIDIIPLRVRTDVHLMRKAWHIGTGILGLMLYFAKGSNAYSTANTLLGIALVGFAFDFLRLRINGLNNAAIKLMKPFMRECERQNMSGLPFYALGAALSLYLFPQKLAVLSIIFLVFSDPISSFVGIQYGRDKILPNKSLQGSLAGFTVCYVLSLVYGLMYAGASYEVIIFALLGGVIGCLSEMLSYFKMDDNFTIPVFSGFGLTLINLILNIF